MAAIIATMATTRTARRSLLTLASPKNSVAPAVQAAITAAALAVIAEAGAEGIELELLRLEPSPIAVFGKPRIDDENAQVFYVHFVMPHLSNGTLTRDSYTVDADEAEEFADYMRHRTLPELRELVREHGALESAA